MFELVTLALFVVLPAAIGYLSASYWTALLPGVSLAAAIVDYATDPPDATDEVDVSPGLWIAFSGVAVVICLVGAAARRRTRSGA